MDSGTISPPVGTMGSSPLRQLVGGFELLAKMLLALQASSGRSPLSPSLRLADDSKIFESGPIAIIKE